MSVQRGVTLAPLVVQDSQGTYLLLGGDQRGVIPGRLRLDILVGGHLGG